MKPIPDDFADYATIESGSQLARRYGVSTGMVSQWRQIARLWLLEQRGGRKPVAIPEDFLEVQVGKTKQQIAAHYGIDRKSIDRMLITAGVTRAFPRFGARPSVVLVPVPVPKPTPRYVRPVAGQAHKIADRPYIDASKAGLAAQFLQRNCPTYRCDADGRQDPHGDFYRYGRAVLTPDEVVERAERNGWRWAIAA